MDSDLDSYGDPNNSTEDCSQPSGYVANMDDCNDSEPTAWSGALEYCDGIDNNCSGNEYDALDAISYHPDSDGDGYGDENEAYPLCEPPGGLLVGCYDVSMFDTGSDGWNGGSLTIYVNGIKVDSGQTGGIQNQDDGEFWATETETIIEEAFCLSSYSDVVTLEYESGSKEYETSCGVTDSTGY